jgi:type IV pilus assembly protein PilE
VRKTTVTGFTLIELMIALVVVGILAAIALPNYMESVRKGRRADAIAALQRVAQAQERWRANNTTYSANVADLGGATSPDRHYTIAVTGATATGYTATATVAAGSPQAGDSRCTVLRLTQAGPDTTRNSTNGNGVTDNSTPNPCWNR